MCIRLLLEIIPQPWPLAQDRVGWIKTAFMVAERGLVLAFSSPLRPRLACLAMAAMVDAVQEMLRQNSEFMTTLQRQ